MAQMEEQGADMALLGAALSVLLSWYQFFYRGNRMRGIFIGLWPPTILAFASYLKQRGMSDRLNSSIVVGPESNTLRRLLR
jgi:hypothetical protein